MICFLKSSGQQDISLDNASDPVSQLTRFTLDFDSYLFHGEAQYYGIRPGFYYGLQSERHLFGVSIPYLHNIFPADYGGYENTTGFGDLKMTYLFAPFHNTNTIGIERVTMSFDATAPTGEYKLGRGVGVWMYKPGLIITWRVAEPVVCYPEIRYQFSDGVANTADGSDGIPDPEDPEKDAPVKNLSMAFPATIQLHDWNGWFTLNVMYTRSLSEDLDYLFIRTDIGKVIGRKSCASLRIAKFIAGQPRLDLAIQANVTFFMR
jgi:hypothetical protein